jgi:hypothetical protein
MRSKMAAMRSKMVDEIDDGGSKIATKIYMVYMVYIVP